MSAVTSNGYRVIVANNMTRNLDLIVHCYSHNDNLKARVVPAGLDYSWSFKMNLGKSTLFWCNLAVQDKRLSFDAFKNLDDDQYPLYWMVFDDGVYGKYYSEGKKSFYTRWNYS
ncbi:S-protein homolog 31 [Linum perenne]